MEISSIVALDQDVSRLSDKQNRDLEKFLAVSCPKTDPRSSVPQDVFSLDRDGLLGINSMFSSSPSLRKERSHLVDPLELEEVVFPSIATYLVKNRLHELLEWSDEELRSAKAHPFLIIACTHLLLLQIHPLKDANHATSFVVLHKLLSRTGYTFHEYCSPLPFFEKYAERYFSSLKQAERSAYENWGTLNIWIEFFLDSLLLSIEELLSECEQKEKRQRLTKVQESIISTIEFHGAATRDTVSKDTGINISTVKYNLSVLVSRGYLAREGAGRTTRYRRLQ